MKCCYTHRPLKAGYCPRLQLLYNIGLESLLSVDVYRDKVNAGFQVFRCDVQEVFPFTEVIPLVMINSFSLSIIHLHFHFPLLFQNNINMGLFVERIRENTDAVGSGMIIYPDEMVIDELYNIHIPEFISGIEQIV